MHCCESVDWLDAHRESITNRFGRLENLALVSSVEGPGLSINLTSGVLQ